MGCRLSKPKKENGINEIPGNHRDSRMIDDAQTICSIDAEWKFRKSDLMGIKKSAYVGKIYYAYNILGLQYYVMVLPNGDGEDYPGEVMMAFIPACLDEREISLESTVSIESAYFSPKFNRVCKAGGMISIYFDKSRVFFDSNSKYFVEDILTIKVKGILKPQYSLVPKVSSPISYQWRIKEEDLKAAKDSKGILRSAEINVPTFSGTKYYLELCPSKMQDTDELNAILYFKTKSGPEKNIKAVYDFSVVSAHAFRANEFTCEDSDGCGVKLCTTTKLFDPTKRFIANGYLTIDVNGILMTERNHFITLNCKNDMAPESPKNNKKDVFIIAREKHIHVHSQVLTAVSPVLSEMRESGSIKNKIVIEDFSSKVVDAAIKLCYSCDESLVFTLEDMLSLFRFGYKYQMKLVTDVAEDYLIKDISASNVVYLAKFSSSDSFNAVKLHQRCLDFLSKCLKKSTPVYAMESIDKDVFVKLLSNHPDAGV